MTQKLKFEDLKKVGEIRDNILTLLRTTDIGDTLVEEMLSPVEKILTDNGVNLKEWDA